MFESTRILFPPPRLDFRFLRREGAPCEGVVFGDSCTSGLRLNGRVLSSSSLAGVSGVSGVSGISVAVDTVSCEQGISVSCDGGVVGRGVLCRDGCAGTDSERGLLGRGEFSRE